MLLKYVESFTAKIHFLMNDKDYLLASSDKDGLDDIYHIN